MDKEQSRQLQDLFESAGQECRSYSGRGMYGKSCLGVEPYSMGDFIADVMSALIEECETEEGRESVARGCAEAFRNMRTDSMGRGMIVYFPDVQFDAGEPDEDEDHDCTGADCCSEGIGHCFKQHST